MLISSKKHIGTEKFCSKEKFALVTSEHIVLGLFFFNFYNVFFSDKRKGSISNRQFQMKH